MHQEKPVHLKKIIIGFLVLLIGTNIINYFMFGYTPREAAVEEAALEAEMEALIAEMEQTLGELSIFGEVLDRVTRNYIEPVDLQVLLRGAIDGALEALGDPNTNYYEADEIDNFLVHTTGTFGGIGVRIVEVDGSIVILETIPNTPAERNGLYPGDRISQVDYQDLDGQGVDRAARLLRGPKGSSVALVIYRPGASKPLTFNLERDDIQINTVTARLIEPGLGYIAISNFDSHTGADFVAQLYSLEDSGLTRGLILDLRGNPGGLLSEAVKVAKELVPEGEITRIVDRSNQVIDIHYSSAAAKPYPIVVLVNEESASAAEIVAGALQDRGAALLVGTKTYGKATVQHLESLTGGNALQLTIAKYLTPSGRDIHKMGLEPDYYVDLPAALKYYRYFLPGTLEQGIYGASVKLLQEMLTELGYPVQPTGYFDTHTADMLASFQEESGLSPSGLFDDLTWIQLRERLDQLLESNDVQMKKAVELTGQPSLWAALRR